MKSIGKVRDIGYVLYRRKNCRNVTVRVMSDGSVRVSAPLSVSVGAVERVIASNYTKLRETVASQERKNLPYRHTWDDGDRFLFWGKECILSLVPGDEDSADYVDDRFRICYRGDKPTPEDLQRVVKEIYRSYAKARIGLEVFRWAERLGLPHPPYAVRDSKRRWGSCSARGTLSFSLRSAALGDEDLSYLVLHEMAHLRHFDHGKQFQAMLASYMPDWKQRQRHIFSVQRQSELDL